jgi:hypothetical protein
VTSECGTSDHGEEFNDLDTAVAGLAGAGPSMGSGFGVGGSGASGQLRGRASVRTPYARSNASATSTPCSTPRTSMSVNDLCNIDDVGE